MSTVESLLDAVVETANIISAAPDRLETTLMGLPTREKFAEIFLLASGKRNLDRLNSAALVSIIEKIYRSNWSLAAEIVNDLPSDVRRVVAPMLSEDTKSILLKVIYIQQQVAELEFTTRRGEFLADLYVFTGKWHPSFPGRLRKCSRCGEAYRVWDGIKFLDGESDEECRGSYHEGESCSQNNPEWSN
jgi:hypothetical protein